MTVRDWQAQQMITRGAPGATGATEFLAYLRSIKDATTSAGDAITAIDAGVTELAAAIAAEQALQDTAIGEVQSDINTLAIWNATQDTRLGGLEAGMTAYGQLSASYTLTSTTSVQKLFDWTANGALTLPEGRYWFDCGIYLLSMSATSGNGAFHLLGAGAATLANIFYTARGIDSTTPLTAATHTGSASITQDSAASMVTAGVGTGLVSTISGMFTVTAAGSIVPSIALVTGIAAVVQAKSYFRCTRIGEAGAVTYGNWT